MIGPRQTVNKVGGRQAAGLWQTRDDQRLPASFAPNQPGAAGWTWIVPAVLVGLSLFIPRATAQMEKLSGKLGLHRAPLELEREIVPQHGGALVYGIAPHSAAGKAGLQPGDVVTALDGKKIRSFDDLRLRLAEHEAGAKTVIEFRRDDRLHTVTLQPTAWVRELSTDSHAATADYLRTLLADRDAVVVRREMVASRWLAGQRRQALAELEQAIERFPGDLGLRIQHLDLLRKMGEFDRYVQESLALADRYPLSLSLALDKVSALMATGRVDQAEREAARIVSQDRWPGESSRRWEGLRLWAISRLRQGQSLEDAPVAPSDRLWAHPELAAIDFWKRRLAGQVPYAMPDGPSRGEVDLQEAEIMFGLVPNKLHGISIEINGTTIPMAIVDTGASHTLLSERTAREADVAAGSSAQPAAGSLSFEIRPALVRELRIGSVTLRNVPVAVGNPPPLVLTKAQVALGIDLMHHLRFTMDHARAKVIVEPASPLPPAPPESAWDIPLWTFPEHCLTVGHSKDGRRARILVDSGNFAQTLVWPTWAKENIPNHQGPAASLLAFTLSNPQHTLRGLTLGDRLLPDWPVIDMPPVTLKGVDLADLVLGHDLLSQYRVIVDVRSRILRLESPGTPVRPPVAPIPLTEKL